MKQLLDWVRGLQEYNHGRRKGRVSVGSGSQDLLYNLGSSIPYGKPEDRETPAKSVVESPIALSTNSWRVWPRIQR